MPRYNGALPVTGLRPDHIERMKAKKAATPTAANTLVKRLRQLLDFAIAKKLIATNPAKAVKLRTVRTDGFYTWTPADVATFEAAHPAGSQARLAMRLMLYTGAARQDVVRMGRQSVADGRISYRRGKQGGEVSLSILPELAEELDRLPAGRMLFLLTEAGKPFTPAGFGNKVRDWCTAAGLPECSAHGLRKSGATALAEAGASTAELMAFLGDRSPRVAMEYVAAANKRTLSDNAFAKLEGRKRERRESNLSEKLDKKERN